MIYWLETASNVWQVVVRLLASWHATEPTRNPRDDLDLREGWHALMSEVEALFDERDTPMMDEAATKDLIALLGPEPTPWVLHAVAWGIDSSMHEWFPMMWRTGLPNDRRWKLQSGDIYPVLEFREDDFGARPNTTRHYNIEVNVTDLPHVRFWDRDDDIEVIFDFSAAAYVDSALLLLAKSTVATSHPIPRFSDYEPLPQTIDVFPVRPRLPADQMRRQIVDLLNSTQTDAVVVAPELSSTDDPLLERKVHESTRQDARPRVIVIGSAHRTVDEAPRNTSKLFFSGRDAPYEHVKFQPWKEVDNEGHLKHEGIQAGPVQLTILAGSSFRLTWCICLDYLISTARDGIAGAGVNLVAVPAMSKKLEPFRNRALELINGFQTVTILANGPTDWGEFNSMIVVPFRRRTATTWGNAESPPANAGYVRWRLADLSATWVEYS